MWSRKNKTKLNSLKANMTIVVLAFFLFPYAGTSQCSIAHIPFKAGEQLNYNVYYFLKKVWVPAGKVRFEVSDSIYLGKNCFHLDGRGKSLKNYDYFFRVRDQYSSLVDKTSLIPYRFLRDVSEGGFELFEDYRFNHQLHTAKVYTNKKDSTQHITMKVPSCTFDVMTCVYRARCIDFSKVKLNDSVPLPMVLDKAIYSNVYIRYTGKARIKGEDGKYYNCIKFKPLLIQGTIFTDGEEMEVYVTDDQNRIPIYVEAKILVGTIKAYLSSYKNNKYPVTAAVN
jgi:hypothetical protein